MTKRKTTAKTTGGGGGGARDYRHKERALMRPEAGAQTAFKRKLEPAEYRYDSSLAPELQWDEGEARGQGEELLAKICAALDENGAGGGAKRRGRGRGSAGGDAAAGGRGSAGGGAAGAGADFGGGDAGAGDGEAAGAGADFGGGDGGAGEVARRAEREAAARDAAAKLRAMSAPFLAWSGKAERGGFTVPTLPLFTHERLSTAAVLDTLKKQYRARPQTLDLFGEGAKNITEKRLGAYEHKNGWQNRLILGDSLQVMNSLLQYESMGGEVQMVYMDPPYGIKFGGNFQPFVRKRDVKDGDDDSITREPEMVQAYRDTWELGAHSWLTYMRDRLYLARALLAAGGSCFVQISDENVHFVRNVMDEVFGRENFVSLISYRTTAGLGSALLSTTGDYIVWYAKDKGSIKYRQLFVPKSFGEGTMFRSIIKANGDDRAMNDRELQGFIEPGDMPYQSSDLVSSGLTPSCVFDVEFEGRTFAPGRNRSWKTNQEGMKVLLEKGRLHAPGNTLRYISYWKDFPVSNLTTLWTDTVGELSKNYVVQTAAKVIQRCMLMTTDPGDLVFDPTCGSGTTAYVAEQWGRRWITADISRVPVALARQRLLTAVFPYYKLKGVSPSDGFVYQRRQNRRGEETGGIVPHVTLKSIANNEPPAEEVLVDKPETIAGARFSGPFCMESVMPPAISPETIAAAANGQPDPLLQNQPEYVARMTEILRLSPNIRLRDNAAMNLAAVRPAGKSLALHAEAESGGELVAIVFGPAAAAISERAVIDAVKEANAKNYNRLLVVAFAVEPAARKTIDACENAFGIPALYVQANTDLTMADLLKNMRSSEVFAACGMPDIRIFRRGTNAAAGAAGGGAEGGADAGGTGGAGGKGAADGGKGGAGGKGANGGGAGAGGGSAAGAGANGGAGGGGEPLYSVRLLGLDVFDPVESRVKSVAGADVPCWMLDTDYDGECFRACQVFFPRTREWDKIRRTLRADFDDEAAALAHLSGDESAPFVAGDERGEIAVKAIDERGNELLVVKSVSEAEDPPQKEQQ